MCSATFLVVAAGADRDLSAARICATPSNLIGGGRPALPLRFGCPLCSIVSPATAAVPSRVAARHVWQLRRQRSGRTQQGFFQVQQTCPKCRGRGQTISDPCIECRGQGLVEKTKTLSVKVPPGVDTGDRIRLSGEGEAGPAGGPPGDLFVQIAVRQHSLFERDGRHLYCEVPISFADAALGGELEVPTLDGRVKLKIPSETQTGKMFRLRGKGVKPVRGGPVGDPCVAPWWRRR